MAKRRRKRPAPQPWWAKQLTEAQLRAKTNQLTEDIMRPGQDEIARTAASQAATIRATSEAASKLLAEHAGVTQQGYNQGAEELKSIGGGYSAEMAARIKGAQDAATEFAKSQGGAPVNAVDPAAMQDVAYHGGVGIPGSALASQGAAATALDKGMADVNVLQGQQDIRQSMMDQEKALLELAKQRPELHSSIMAKLQDLEMAKLEYRLKQQAQNLYESQFGEQIRHHVVGERQGAERNRLSKLRYQEQVRTHDVAIQKAEAEGRQPNASLSRAYGYIVDKDGNPILDKNGNHIQVAKSSTSKSKKEKSNAQYQKAVGEAESMFQDSQPTPAAQPGLPPGPPERAWKWGEAMRYLQNRYGVTKARARQALIAAGFKPPKPRPGYIPGTKNRGRGGAGPR